MKKQIVCYTAARNAMEMEQKRTENIRKQFLDMLDNASENLYNGTEVEEKNANALNVEFDSNTDFDKNIKYVANMKPVAKLNGNEFAKSSTDLVTQVSEYFNSIGNKVESKYGTVILNRTGVKSSISHGIGRKKAVAFMAVPDVIKNGRIIDYTDNYKNRDYDTAVFSAPIKIGNEDYYVATVVNVNKNSNEYYLHEIAMVNKKEDETLFKTGNGQKTTPSNASSSIYSLLNKLQNVNNNETKFSLDIDSDGNKLTQQQAEYFKKSKVRDENGNLLKVYHGTTENFTVFDKTKGRSNMDIQGMFFSPWEIDAKGYGSNVNAYYINITNPASERMGYMALRKFQGQNNAGVKAREYLENLGYDGVNNGDEEYIAFNSNQIKLADNLTPTENEDIRFSRDVNIDEFDETEYTNVKLSKAEYNKLYSEALTWDSDKVGKVCHKFLNNAHYYYTLDNDYNLIVLDKENTTNVHEREEIKNANTDRGNFSGGYEISENFDRYNNGSIRFSENRRTTANNDKFNKEKIQREGNGNRGRNFEDVNYDKTSEEKYSRDVEYSEYLELKRENKHTNEVQSIDALYAVNEKITALFLKNKRLFFNTFRGRQSI